MAVNNNYNSVMWMTISRIVEVILTHSIYVIAYCINIWGPESQQDEDGMNMNVFGNQSLSNIGCYGCYRVFMKKYGH